MQVFVMISNVGITINCRCECKELIGKGRCDDGFIRNPSICECECDKSCDVGEYLDSANCKCRKILVDKLVQECSEDEILNAHPLNTTGTISNTDEYNCLIYINLMIIKCLILLAIAFISCYFY